MSVRPCASWQRRHMMAKVESIRKGNIARFKAEAEAKARIEAIASENLAKKAREEEALRLARIRISRQEWEEWCGKIGDIARNGRPDYSAQDLLNDLRKWGALESTRFIRHFDKNYIAPAVRLG